MKKKMKKNNDNNVQEGNNVEGIIYLIHDQWGTL